MELPERLKQARKKEGLTQKDLAEKIGVDPATISRLEKGSIKNPTDFILNGLEKVFGSNFLSEDFNNSVQEDRKILSFGFGHCIWAAPIIKGYCKDGGYHDIRITSYGNTVKDGSLDPIWLKLNDNDTKGVQKSAGPILNKTINLVDKDEVFFNKLQPLSKEHAYEIYTADELVQLVNRGALQFLAVPSEVYENNPSQLLRAASITYTTKGGCYLCVVGQKETIKSLELAPFSFQLIKDALKTKEILNTIHSERTIAQKYFRKYLSPMLDRFEIKHRPISIEFGRWDRIEGTLKHLIDRKAELFLVICWEPQLSWIQKWIDSSLGDTLSCKKYDFSQLLSDQKIPYVSFDILFHRESLNNLSQSQITSTTEFFKRLADNVTQLNRGDKPIDVQNEAVLISQYLNMDIERAAEELHHVNFRFSFYPDWMEWMVARTGSTAS